MTTTTKNGPAVRQHHEANAHLNSAEDHMNISTVADQTDIDIRVPGFHQGNFTDRTATHYIICQHEEPVRHPDWEPKIEAMPESYYRGDGNPAVAGFVWGQDPDDPTEEYPWEHVFTSLGRYEFVGYDIDMTPGIDMRDIFTGLFRKVEVGA